MIRLHIFFLIFGLIILCGSSGCDSERAKRERAKMELEENTRRETDSANKAITDLNRRMFGKKSEVEQPSTQGTPPTKP